MEPDKAPEPTSSPDLSPEAGRTPPTSPVPSSPDPGRSRWAWAWVILAALVAGPLAWIAGESTQDVFVLTEEEAKGGEFSMTATDKGPYLRARRRVTIRNSVVHYGILGVALGTALGLAGGMARRSLGGAVRGGLVGAAVGGTAAVLASLALIPVFLSNYQHDRQDMFLPLLVHGGIWSAIGASGGLALAVGLGGGLGLLGRAAAGGVAGAILGTVAYELIYTVAFPLARSELPIPTEPPIRLLAHMVIALSITSVDAWSALAKGRISEPTSARA